MQMRELNSHLCFATIVLGISLNLLLHLTYHESSHINYMYSSQYYNSM